MVKKEGLNLKENKKRVDLRFSFAYSGKGWVKAYKTNYCNCFDGALRCEVGYGLFLNSDSSYAQIKLSNLSGIYKMRIFNETKKTYSHRLVYTTTTGWAYQHSATGNSYSSIVNLGTYSYGVPFYGKDRHMHMGLFGTTKCILLGDGFVQTDLGLQTAYGAGCYYKDRLFVGIKPSAIAYSSPDDPSDFAETVNGGGRIYFPAELGEVVSILPFDGTLYAFFEHGIVRLDVGGTPKEFRTERIGYTNGKIFWKTVCAGNGYVFFLSNEGLNRFDGKKAELILQEAVIKPSASEGKECAASWNGGAIIRYRTAWSTYNLLYVSADGKDCFYSADAEAMTGGDMGEVLFRRNTSVANLVAGVSSRGLAQFRASTDFGVKGRKRLKKLIFDAEGEFSVSVESKNVIMSKDLLVEENGLTEVELPLYGEEFLLTIYLYSGAVIRGMTAELNVF